MITPSFSCTATERVLPKLALDFTTGLLDSRVTFTRSTGASNPATYFNSSGFVTAAANNAPRFDYDPVTLQCKGLLIEESRQNRQTYSEDFRDTAAAGSTRPWMWFNTTVTVNATTAPDNAVTADALFETSATGVHDLRAPGAITGTAAGTNYVQSIFVKPNGRTKLWLYDNSGSSVTQHDLTGSGSASVVGGPVTVYSTENVGNGWYRCIRGGTTNASGNASPCLRLLDASGNSSYAGDITKGVYVWGAQAEFGAFATSYIPTTTTALTRNADVATMTGTNFSDWWQASRGGVLVRARPGTVSGTRPWLQFDDGTANEIIALRGNTTNPELYIVDGGTPQAQIDAGTIAANIDYSLTGWWQTNDCKARLDSGAVATDTTATIPTVTQARLGSDGTNYLNGHLASISYYDSFFGQPIYTRRKNKVFPSLF